MLPSFLANRLYFKHYITLMADDICRRMDSIYRPCNEH